MKNILLVEDNEAIVKGLEFSLETDGFKVTSSNNIYDCKCLLTEQKFNIILLDIGLPDGDGFELCKYIKQNYDVPIIFLTAKDEESDVVLGLEIGADDYIIKPFRIRELISRINNILRRYSDKAYNIIKVQNITLDLDKNLLYKDDKEVILTALEYRILLMLFNNIGKIVTREQILDKIWDIAGNFVNDNTLTVYIKRIREKIEADQANPKIIKTIRGIGYRVGE